MESDNNNEIQKLLNHKRQSKNSLEILPLKINKKEEKSEAKMKNICSYCKNENEIIKIKNVEDIFKYLKRVNLFKPEYIDFEYKYKYLKVEKNICKKCLNKIGSPNEGGIKYIINIFNLKIENNLFQNVSLLNTLIPSSTTKSLNLLFNQINNVNKAYQDNITLNNPFSNQLKNNNNIKNNNNFQHLKQKNKISNNNKHQDYNLDKRNIPLNEKGNNIENEIQSQMNIMKLCNHLQKNSLDIIYQ